MDMDAAAVFVPRPFPPPALEHVPLPYILDQLHNLAAHYWDKPDSADCTLLIPIVARHEPAEVPVSAPAAPDSQRRRPTRMTSKLHLDYLLAQSALFRDLFSGKPTPGPLEHSRPDSPNTPPLLPRTQLPPHRRPHLLPGSTPSHPLIHLPLPDPASFPHLVHYMYFGVPTALEAALDAGAIHWAGVVRNAEYLGMRAPLKAFLGRWYARNAAAHASAGACRPPIVFEEDEDEVWMMDCDRDDAGSSSSGASSRSRSSYSRSGSEYDSDYDSGADDDDDEEDEDDQMSDTDDTLESVNGAETDVAETAEEAKARIVKKVTSWMDDGAEPVRRGRSLARKTSMMDSTATPPSVPCI